MRYQLFVLSILLFLIGGFHKGVVSAETTATITVCTSGCTTNTWGTAINLANSGDTISIQSDLQVTQGAVFNGKSVTIQGNNHTVSKASGSTGAFLGLIQSTATINNLTFIGGNNAVHGTNGGAVWAIDDSDLTLDNAKFHSNHAASGGAIYADDSLVTVNNSEFEENDATAGAGGAIQSNGSTLTVYNSLFLLNTSTDDGGAIDHSKRTGGVSNGPLSITASTFQSNAAFNDGGGLSYSSGGSVAGDSTSFDVSKNLFSSNIAGDGAGLSAFSNDAFANIISNNTFVDNRASNVGGGLFLSGNGHLENNSIYRNHAPSSANVYLEVDADRRYKARNNIIALPQGGGDNCRVELRLNVNYDNSAAVYNNLADDESCIGFTIEADPRLYDPADNGGLTLTMRPAFDSPIFNAGNWTGTTASDDQRGVARPPNGVSDLGAYERVTQGDCQIINETIPGGSASSGLTKVISAPSFLSGEIIDVDVTLELNTTYLSDIIATVRSPFNVSRTIVDRPGYPESINACLTSSLDGVFDSDGNYPTLDSTCTGSGAPIVGRFEPKTSLTAWNYTQTEGNWILNVTDATFGAPSSLTAWCLAIEYFPDSAVVTPTAVMLSERAVTGSSGLAIILPMFLSGLILSIGMHSQKNRPY